MRMQSSLVDICRCKNHSRTSYISCIQNCSYMHILTFAYVVIYLGIWRWDLYGRGFSPSLKSAFCSLSGVSQWSEVQFFLYIASRALYRLLRLCARSRSLVEECAHEERVSCKENRLDGIWRSSESCYHCLCSTPRSNLNYEATQIPSSNVSVRVHRLPPAVVYSYSNPPHFVQSTFSGTLAGRSNETILQLLRHSPA